MEVIRLFLLDLSRNKFWASKNTIWYNMAKCVNNILSVPPKRKHLCSSGRVWGSYSAWALHSGPARAHITKSKRIIFIVVLLLKFAGWCRVNRKWKQNWNWWSMLEDIAKIVQLIRLINIGNLLRWCALISTDKVQIFSYYFQINWLFSSSLLCIGRMLQIK